MAVALLVDTTVLLETTATNRFPTMTIESMVLEPSPALPKALTKLQEPPALEKTPMQPGKAVQRLLQDTAGATAGTTARRSRSLLVAGGASRVAAGKVVLQSIW